MSEKLNVITGATGLVGSHIAEQLRQKGERVRALVRSTSDVRFLKSIDVEFIEGDLQDSESLKRAFKDATIVYHCAAKVGDWGAWKQFEQGVIHATGNVLNACREMQPTRVLHISSVTVYGHPIPGDGQLFTEEEPQGQRLRIWDYYCRSKIEAEKLCRDYPGDVTIVRPSWIFGPRDRNTLPRIFKAFRAGRVRLIGSGENKLNIVYAGDVASGAISAANAPQAVGQAYHLCSPGEITQQQLLDLLTEAFGQRRITRHIPFRLAYLGGFLAEVIGRVIRMKRPPHVTRYGVGLVGRPTVFSIEKARNELNWQPGTPVRQGLKLALEWYRENYPDEAQVSSK